MDCVSLLLSNKVGFENCIGGVWALSGVGMQVARTQTEVEGASVQIIHSRGKSTDST